MCVLTALVGVNYMAICRHYPDGGGVYASVRHRSEIISIVGAFLLIADYIVTAALSALSACAYFGVPHPEKVKTLEVLAILPHGTGTVTCSNGQSMQVKLQARGGGLSVGKSSVRSGVGEFSGARIIMLSMSEGDGEIRRALRSGASAYLLKTMPKDKLLACIRSVHAGRKQVPDEVAARLAEHLGEEDLTPRELDVLRLIRDGNRNKQIADRLGIAETTVNFHIKNIVDKLGANDRAHAVTIAVRRGLLTME